MKQKKKPVSYSEESFWSKVKKGENCWEWLGYRDRDGYGQSHLSQGRPILAHRRSMMIHLKRSLTKDEHVLHTCDNPCCVNPAHLFLGTPLENNRDRMRKNRSAWGEKHPDHKLTLSEVIEVKRLAAEGSLSQRAIGRRFGVAHVTIGRILKKKTWRRVP